MVKGCHCEADQTTIGDDSNYCQHREDLTPGSPIFGDFGDRSLVDLQRRGEETRVSLLEKEEGDHQELPSIKFDFKAVVDESKTSGNR
jgi:hypothetical protein